MNAIAVSYDSGTRERVDELQLPYTQLTVVSLDGMGVCSISGVGQ